MKSLEKDARSLESINTKLQGILEVAEKDNNELNEEVRNREEIVNTTCKKLEALNAEI